ncbi:general secretion pathway protein GspB [Marinobacter apostichopi]|uniref:general secretion pathway protein GspB n=2 Tax=Marinobacter TaxID=2742 RepID=UPI00257276D1|nr:general secretion pathway protein GspB [Marinobacter sp. LA51]
MSYILDALRKSETERRQGKIPDLGHQVQLIHRPKKRKASPVVWLALALVVNAGVLGVLFLPQGSPVGAVPASEQPANVVSEMASTTDVEKKSVQVEVSESVPEAAPSPVKAQADEPLAESGSVASNSSPRERPTIIVPAAEGARDNSVLRAPAPAGRVPHLVELPLSFQKSVPDLTFNSHIYASDPFASRVMINSNYLRRGDSFSGLRVESITQDGVVLSKQGQRFRVGIVRDWVSPR